MFTSYLCRVGAPMLLASALMLPHAFASAADAPAAAPYAGQQDRSIKSLSESDIEALLAGQGAGFAKAAELNGYPGPAHVLELAEPLRLSESQRAATQVLMSEHRTRARKLGQELVSAEADLDRLFQRKQADPRAVDRATETVGLLQARLRAEHLNTHLAQAALLDPEQTRRYAVLRGYDANPVSVPEAPSAHQHHGNTGSRP